ncbi:MAG: DUF58 domain-containing protein [Chloroflexi bacterium]|nr:DUF58 domain-containing protein [Chloroflexota bacterium]
MKRLIGILALTAIVLAFAVITGFPPLRRLFYLLAIAILGGYLWAWFGLRWLEVRIERRTPRVSVGQPVDERMTVRNTSFLPKPWLEVVDLNDIPGHHTGRVVGLPGRGFRSWRVQTLARKRGVFALGPLRVATGDPFGLFRMQRTYAGQQQVVVLPAVVPLPRFFTSSADLPGEGGTRFRSHQVSPHVASVREYAPGDSLSRIHWPTTVRQGVLMVKEFDVGLTSDVWVLLDMEAAVHINLEEDSTEEMSVTIAASVLHYYAGRGLPVGLAASSMEFPILPPERGPLQEARALEVLAQVHADGQLSLAEAIARMDPWLTRNVTLVVVTPSASHAWVGTLGTLAQRGLRQAAVLVDGSTFQQAPGVGSVGPASLAPLAPGLRSLGIPSYVLGKGDNIATALDQPVAEHWDAFGQEPPRGEAARRGGRA